MRQGGTMSYKNYLCWKKRSVRNEVAAEFREMKGLVKTKVGPLFEKKEENPGVKGKNQITGEQK